MKEAFKEVNTLLEQSKMCLKTGFVTNPLWKYPGVYKILYKSLSVNLLHSFQVKVL